ncbi:MAG: thioredoxin [Rikenellaceae bacterium]|nr:thioredoxin [Rikenellaceae bacterium]MCL2693190.1 thioredoxin [Rikenellaceae bacterium]
MMKITSANLQELLDSGKPVVIDFGAAWCGPCKVVEPLIAELATEYEGKAMIGKCDIEENNDIAIKYGVRNIPTVIFLKDGAVAEKIVGATNKAKYEAALGKLL